MRNFLEVRFLHRSVGVPFVWPPTFADMAAVALSYRVFQPLAVNPVVEFIQHDICQQGRQYAALWGAFWDESTSRLASVWGQSGLL